jgi:hypothetical protein
MDPEDAHQAMDNKAPENVDTDKIAKVQNSVTTKPAKVTELTGHTSSDSPTADSNV